MTLYVVDASMFGPLLFEDEKDELFGDLPRLIANEQCIVPEHWHLEVMSQLLSGLRRGRTTEDFAEQALAKLQDLPLTVDHQTRAQSGASFALAKQHRLTVYDAAYLELALRCRTPLLTYDRDLRRAASASSVPLPVP